MSHLETYLLIISEGETIPFSDLLPLCRAIKAEHKYSSIRRKLLKQSTAKFNGYMIKKVGQAKEIKSFEIEGKIYNILNKSKRTK